jgi:DNA-binding PadR family transcriptional regulator
MSKGFILFLLTEAVPTVPYEILKMEKKSGTDIWRIAQVDPDCRYL